MDKKEFEKRKETIKSLVALSLLLHGITAAGILIFKVKKGFILLILGLSIITIITTLNKLEKWVENTQ